MVLTFYDCTTAVMEYQNLRLDALGPFPDGGRFPARPRWADGASQGVEGQRWHTGQGKFVPGAFTLPMTLYETTGGVIGGSPEPAFAIRTQGVGTATATFFDCHSAQLTFTFTEGSNAGASGTINLSRVGPTPQGCGADLS
jgi:hypothetical protein